MPARHRWNARFIIDLLEAWQERLEREMDTLYARREDAEDKLSAIVEAA